LENPTVVPIYLSYYKKQANKKYLKQGIYEHGNLPYICSIIILSNEETINATFWQGNFESRRGTSLACFAKRPKGIALAITRLFNEVLEQKCQL